jgi:hypothetical protein
MATPTSKLTRALTLAAMLAAVSLTSMTAVAQAHTRNVPASTRHRALGRLEFQATGDHPAPSRQDTAADTTARRLLARERFSIPNAAHPRLLLDEERSSLLNLPNDTPSQLTSPTPTATEPSGQPSWLIPALGGMAVVLTLAVGITVLVVRHTNGRQRAGQTV